MRLIISRKRLCSHLMIPSRREYAYANEIGCYYQSWIRYYLILSFLIRSLDCKFPETMSRCYNPGGYFQLGTSIMDNPGDAKYGMTYDQIIEAFKILRAKGLSILVSIHSLQVIQYLMNIIQHLLRFYSSWALS